MRVEWGLTSEVLTSLLQWKCDIQDEVTLFDAEYDELSDMVAVEIEISADDWNRMAASQDDGLLGEFIQ
jgi:hypothetical protein